jgi:uncharacterized damage-inducible protein DinB
MDLLDRLIGHDAWTTRQLLLRCRPLSDEQLDQEFDIGHRTVRATLTHIIRNVEVWSQLMAGQHVAHCMSLRTLCTIGLSFCTCSAGLVSPTCRRATP